jgi:hypothetical protein
MERHEQHAAFTNTAPMAVFTKRLTLLVSNVLLSALEDRLRTVGEDCVPNTATDST